MDTVKWDEVEPAYSNGRIYVGGFSKPCGKCSAPFTARSDRDKYCHACTTKHQHITRGLKTQSYPYRLYTGLGAFDGSGFVYYHAQMGNAYLHTDHDIQWYEWLRWAYDQHQQHPTNVVWSGKYHWANIFKSLPRHRGMKMLDDDYGYGNGKRTIPTPYPVDTDASESPDGQRWLIRLFYNERVLEFQPKTCDCSKTECKHAEGNWMRVQDAYQFFEQPLSDLIGSDLSLGMEGQRRVIVAGDEVISRNERMPEGMAYEYGLALHEITGQIMERKKEAFSRANIRLLRNKEYGIGCAATQAMINHGITPRKRRGIASELIRVGLASYFGPWMEDVACGIAEGETHEYDLNSAFGAILATMPCLEHGWTHGHGRPRKLRNGYLRIEHAYLRGPGTMPFGPALFREKNGHVISPVESAGWHWTHELAEREKNGLIAEWSTDEWWEKEPCDCSPPFAWVRELFDLRTSYPKGTAEERLFRLLPDALYGKLAESGNYATFANPLSASYVTSMCRALVLQAIHTHQDGIHGVLKIMSDSFLTRNEHKKPERLPIGIGLGEWKHKAHIDATLFDPSGIWWSEGSEKTSGIKPEDMPFFREAADAAFRSWDKSMPGLMNEFPEIHLDIAFRITTLTQAARTSWADAGRIETDAKETWKYNPNKKRDAEQIYWDDKFGFFRSYPKVKGEDGIESASYSRKTEWKDDDDRLGFSHRGPVVSIARKALGR